MGQETDMVNGVLGLNGKQLMTNPAPGQYVTAYQDANGKNSIWKATLEDGLFTFTVSIIIDVQLFKVIKLKLISSFSLWKICCF